MNDNLLDTPETEEDDPETPTRRDELASALSHLNHSREEVTRAYRSAVLPRDVRAKLEAIETELFDAIYDFEMAIEAA